MLKKIIKNKIKAFVIKKGYKLNSVFYFNFLESILYQKIKAGKQISFIQIGANDGKRFDPVYEFIKFNTSKIKGYVLEPVSDYFKDLKDTYKDYPDIKPINIAIHNNLLETTIYKVAKEYETKVPEFALGIASFNKNHHKKTKIPTEYITEETVKCTALANFIKDYNIEELDMLILDTEGYDYDIITNIDFNMTSPSIIHFEHGLKAKNMNKEQFIEIKQLLNQQDYQLFINEADVTAIKTMLVYG